MCYTIYISTNTNQNLTRFNTHFISFERVQEPSQFSTLLKNPNLWFVGSKSGCSCTFRHLTSVEMGFGPVVDWYPEDPDEIQGTLQFIRAVRSILKDNFQVDCVDIWEGTLLSAIQEKIIHLDQLPDTHFRFFENHYFKFTRSK